MYEWLHSGDKFNIDRFKDKNPNSPKVAEYLELVRDLTNGIKHFKTKSTTTRRQGGFSSAFSDAYARPLIIVSSKGCELPVDDLLKSLVNFWESQLKI